MKNNKNKYNIESAAANAFHSAAGRQ